MKCGEEAGESGEAGVMRVDSGVFKDCLLFCSLLEAALALAVAGRLLGEQL